MSITCSDHIARTARPTASQSQPPPSTLLRKETSRCSRSVAGAGDGEPCTMPDPAQRITRFFCGRYVASCPAFLGLPAASQPEFHSVALTRTLIPSFPSAATTTAGTAATGPLTAAGLPVSSSLLLGGGAQSAAPSSVSATSSAAAPTITLAPSAAGPAAATTSTSAPQSGLAASPSISAAGSASSSALASSSAAAQPSAPSATSMGKRQRKATSSSSSSSLSSLSAPLHDDEECEESSDTNMADEEASQQQQLVAPTEVITIDDTRPRHAKPGATTTARATATAAQPARTAAHPGERRGYAHLRKQRGCKLSGAMLGSQQISLTLATLAEVLDELDSASGSEAPSETSVGEVPLASTRTTAQRSQQAKALEHKAYAGAGIFNWLCGALKASRTPEAVRAARRDVRLALWRKPLSLPASRSGSGSRGAATVGLQLWKPAPSSEAFIDVVLARLTSSEGRMAHKEVRAACILVKRAILDRIGRRNKSALSLHR
ncbi:hypothetical protein BDZ90DRAFT_262882 [Jaminaea rosea]|uniref:Uncharacterized protein n=1 Tax=Jaminaea rosea TaxID=1569628 RepID=A0A316UM89_9BASI|nr:hypothetical protein BDZ90DRAFT_262882 [Jaminaea rosea]PWN25033.1 hypothetical protein BDZ90DRAFT_262882 [Jaminaea rosea]